MEWSRVIGDAVQYMEGHIMEDISVYDVAAYVHVSPFYFHKGFSLLCGYSMTEYLRNRRMAMAGEELITSGISVTELAMKYGYDSPDSFSKAFSRFHGHTPLAVRREQAAIKTFAPLKLSISLSGGYIMDYRIESKASFTVVGVAREFGYDNARQAIPLFWEEYFSGKKNKPVSGMFGINIDLRTGEKSGKSGLYGAAPHDGETPAGQGKGKFEYLIADLYDSSAGIPEGCVGMTIPAFTWAVFPCEGALADSLQNINRKIFSEWLPASQYEFAAGYCVEMYDEVDKYPKGTDDPDYYAEIWIPVKKQKPGGIL